MKAKQVATLGLSAAMCLSLAAPAFASTNKTTKITGTYQEIPIAVTVPTTGTATINPYGLPVKVMGTAATNPKELASISGQKITTMPMAIYSKTETGLLVGATVTGEIKGENLKLTTTAIPDGATTNTALIFLETKSSALKEENLAKETSETKFGPFEGWNPDTANSGANAGPDTTVVNEVKNWSATSYSDARNQILVGTTAKTKNAIGYLSKAADTGSYDASGNYVDGTAGGGLDLQTRGAMWFRLAGDVVSNPKTAWTKADGVTVTVAFTFTPTESAGAPGAITNDAAAKAAPTSSELNAGVNFSLDSATTATPAKMTFASDAIYTWEVVSGPDGNNLGFTDANAQTGELKGTTAKPGDYVVKLTVKENNVPYVATFNFTVA